MTKDFEKLRLRTFCGPQLLVAQLCGMAQFVPNNKICRGWAFLEFEALSTSTPTPCEDGIRVSVKVIHCNYTV